MEVFEVEYEGEKIEVKKYGKSSIAVDLPIRWGNRGAIYRDRIVHEERGWRFTSTQDDCIDYYFHMWLKNDGRMAWANDMSYGIQESSEPFNPNYPNMGVLNDTALMLYSIVEQIKEYQKRDMPTSDLYSLRKLYLTTTLRLLGYDSIDAVEEKPNDSIGYLALNRVAKQLEEYRDLSALVHFTEKLGDIEVFTSTAPNDMDRNQAIEFARPVKEQIDSNVQFMQRQERELASKRAVVPDYRTKMSEKTGVYACDNYENIVRKTALLLLELNSDLLTPEQREKFGIAPFKVKDELSLKDRISKLIDSKEYNDACSFENEFAHEESRKLVKRIMDMLEGTTVYDSVTKELAQIAETEMEEVESRKKAVDIYEKIDAKYYSKRRKTPVRVLEDEYTY